MLRTSFQCVNCCSDRWSEAMFLAQIATNCRSQCLIVSYLTWSANNRPST